jgi:hypothetical protein
VRTKKDESYGHRVDGVDGVVVSQRFVCCCGGKMTRTNCKLGAVQSQDDGWGFVVTNEHHRPLVGLTYDTKAEAEEAHGLMAKVIARAVVTPSGSGAGQGIDDSWR